MNNFVSKVIKTQRKVTVIFSNTLGYRNLGHWKERTVDDMQLVKIILLFVMVIAACSKQEKQGASTFEKYEVHDSYVFLSPEIADFVGSRGG